MTRLKPQSEGDLGWILNSAQAMSLILQVSADGGSIDKDIAYLQGDAFTLIVAGRSANTASILTSACTNPNLTLPLLVTPSQQL